ncbi:MAG TPA: S9 family peptidase [Mycobacteriales bacterium]|nr:S9 family peptidase [Mycobacteriales bacterium]
MTAFDDIKDFLATPRVGDLQLSPDGRRLVATVGVLDDTGAKRLEALWEIDPQGAAPARRLTFSPRGESTPRWASDGSLLFLSARGDDDETPSSLWLLPPSGAEAHEVLARPGGVSRVVAARASDVIVVAGATMPAATDTEADDTLRKARKDRKVAAILHESSPIRFWDHDLGPAELRLLSARLTPDGHDDLRDLTPTPRRALDEQAYDVSPDGRTVVTGWAVDEEPGYPITQLVAIDVASGDHRLLAAQPHTHYSSPVISPDGARVACIGALDSSYEEPETPQVWVIDIASGSGRVVAADADLWPDSACWSADGTALFFTSDQQGHHPIFRIDLESGELTRLTVSGHYTSLCIDPDGETLFALRDHVDSPPRPVRLTSRASDQTPLDLPAPGEMAVPGRIEDVDTVVDDGTVVRGWLVLPDGASADEPVPLLLWIHGGPLNSWNSWSWRWNPWLMAAKGYAVLLPDPALSTGYGRAMVQRGWGQWGGAPYTDLMTITDEVVKRPDIDETRTAAMGGSYGGYMANWVAGHTDRFRCIVTHASLWALDQFQGTTDHPAYWAREWGLPHVQPERYAQWSPHHYADGLGTPMLVIHGDRDYRVPIGEALRLWWDLQRREVPSKFLYFPDEGHWILKPGNAEVWYETVWAWLAAHVLGEEWRRPTLV